MFENFPLFCFCCAISAARYAEIHNSPKRRISCRKSEYCFAKRPFYMYACKRKSCKVTGTISTGSVTRCNAQKWNRWGGRERGHSSGTPTRHQQKCTTHNAKYIEANEQHLIIICLCIIWLHFNFITSSVLHNTIFIHNSMQRITKM